MTEITLEQAIELVETGQHQRICKPGGWEVWREDNFVVWRDGQTTISREIVT
jgi:hypothetical protein